MSTHLGHVHVQTLDQSVPALGERVQSGLQLVGHILVLDAGQKVLAHGAEPVHGGMLRLQLRLQHLMDQSHWDDPQEDLSVDRGSKDLQRGGAAKHCHPPPSLWRS